MGQGWVEFFFDILLYYFVNVIIKTLYISQSAEYDKRVANISIFVYIGSPGLHQNSRQAPGSSRHSVLACRRLANIYNIYRLSVHNFIFSIERTSLLTYFGTECLISHLAASALTQLIFKA